MRTYIADLHIHTCLSPCGGLRMSPRTIVDAARANGVTLISVTDHNTAGMVAEVERVARERGMSFLSGIELQTQEEVHILAYFDEAETCKKFAAEIYAFLPERANDPDLFGDQVAVDEDETIVYVERKLLVNALQLSLEDVVSRVKSYGGLAVPAHVDRAPYGLIPQLGFCPEGLHFPLIEADGVNRPEECQESALLWSSDAHSPEQIGSRVTVFRIKAPTVDEIRLAASGEDGRSATVQRQVTEERRRVG